MTELRATAPQAGEAPGWYGIAPGAALPTRKRAGGFSTYQARLNETSQDRARAELREILTCAAAAVLCAAILGATHLVWTGPVHNHIAARIDANSVEVAQ
nr:hypothetical protein [uncultured Celeribacter sp.]